MSGALTTVQGQARELAPKPKIQLASNSRPKRRLDTAEDLGIPRFRAASTSLLTDHRSVDVAEERYPRPLSLSPGDSRRLELPGLPALSPPSFIYSHYTDEKLRLQSLHSMITLKKTNAAVSVDLALEQVSSPHGKSLARRIRSQHHLFIPSRTDETGSLSDEENGASHPRSQRRRKLRIVGSSVKKSPRGKKNSNEGGAQSPAVPKHAEDVHLSSASSLSTSDGDYSDFEFALGDDDFGSPYRRARFTSGMGEQSIPDGTPRDKLLLRGFDPHLDEEDWNKAAHSRVPFYDAFDVDHYCYEQRKARWLNRRLRGRQGREVVGDQPGSSLDALGPQRTDRNAGDSRDEQLPTANQKLFFPLIGRQHRDGGSVGVLGAGAGLPGAVDEGTDADWIRRAKAFLRKSKLRPNPGGDVGNLRLPQLIKKKTGTESRPFHDLSLEQRTILEFEQDMKEKLKKKFLTEQTENAAAERLAKEKQDAEALRAAAEGSDGASDSSGFALDDLFPHQPTATRRGDDDADTDHDASSTKKGTKKGKQKKTKKSFWEQVAGETDERFSHQSSAVQRMLRMIEADGHADAASSSPNGRRTLTQDSEVEPLPQGFLTVVTSNPSSPKVILAEDGSPLAQAGVRKKAPSQSTPASKRKEAALTAGLAVDHSLLNSVAQLGVGSSAAVSGSAAGQPKDSTASDRPLTSQFLPWTPEGGRPVNSTTEPGAGGSPISKDRKQQSSSSQRKGPPQASPTKTQSPAQLGKSQGLTMESRAEALQRLMLLSSPNAVNSATAADRAGGTASHGREGELDKGRSPPPGRTSPGLELVIGGAGGPKRTSPARPPPIRTGGSTNEGATKGLDEQSMSKGKQTMVPKSILATKGDGNDPNGSFGLAVQSTSTSSNKMQKPNRGSPTRSTSIVLPAVGSDPEQGKTEKKPRKSALSLSRSSSFSLSDSRSTSGAKLTVPVAPTLGGKAPGQGERSSPTRGKAPNFEKNKKKQSNSMKGALDDVDSASDVEAENEVEAHDPEASDIPQYSGVTTSDLYARTRLTKGCPPLPALPIASHDPNVPSKLCAVVVSFERYADERILPCPRQSKEDADALSLMLQVLGYKVYRITNTVAKPATKDLIVGTIKTALTEAGKGAALVPPELRSDGNNVNEPTSPTQAPGATPSSITQAQIAAEGMCLVYIVGRGCEGTLHGYEETVHYFFHGETKLTNISRHSVVIVEELVQLKGPHGIRPTVMGEFLSVATPLKGATHVGSGFAMVCAGAKSHGSDMLVYYPTRVLAGAFTWYLMKGLQGDAVRSGTVSGQTLNAYIKETLHKRFLKTMSIESKENEKENVKQAVNACFDTDASAWSRDTKGVAAFINKDNLLFKYKAELTEKKKMMVQTPCRFVVDVVVDIKYLKDMKRFAKLFVKRAQSLFYPSGKFYSAPSKRRLKLLQVFRTGELQFTLDPAAMADNLHMVVADGSVDDELEELTGGTCQALPRRYKMHYRLYNSNAVIQVQTSAPNGPQQEIPDKIFQEYYVKNKNKLGGFHIFQTRERVSFYFAGCERDFLQFMKHGTLGSFCSPTLFNCEISYVSYQQLLPQLTFKQKGSSSAAAAASQLPNSPTHRASPTSKDGPPPSLSATHSPRSSTSKDPMDSSSASLSFSQRNSPMWMTTMNFADRRRHVEQMFILISKLQSKWRGHFLRMRLNPIRDGARSLLHHRDREVVQVELKERTALKWLELKERRGCLEFVTEYNVRLRLLETAHRAWCQIVELKLNFVFRRHEPGHRERVEIEEQLDLLVLYEAHRRGRSFIQTIQYGRLLLGAVKIIASEVEKRTRSENIEHSDRQKLKAMESTALLELRKKLEKKEQEKQTAAGLRVVSQGWR